ncbi:C40 family peptidase [Pararhodobacter sp.]|uniref:C40 family peptidase n=1 Tax=Pararhodobacter sp. TaxID=2127056 RepID=UPI002FDE30B1
MASFNPAILEASGAYLGTEEWPGARHNPVVLGFFAASGNGHVQDDETPWCAAFVGAVLAELALPNTGKLNARSYLDWGLPVPASEARPGDVVILWRGQLNGWQGHVGFLVGFDGDGVILRGGNQGNSVSDARYPVSRVLGYRRAVQQAGNGRQSLRHGARGQAVCELQQMLVDLRYPLGHVDGLFGDRTREAVLAFQADNELAVDGVVGRETWETMDSAEPRLERDVDAQDLRERGSRTIRDADRGQALTTTGIVGLGGLGVIIERTEEAAALFTQGSGLLDRAQAAVMAYWPILLVGGAGLLLWRYFDQIKAARVEDARSGRNVSR